MLAPSQLSRSISSPFKHQRNNHHTKQLTKLQFRLLRTITASKLRQRGFIARQLKLTNVPALATSKVQQMWCLTHLALLQFPGMPTLDNVPPFLDFWSSSAGIQKLPGEVWSWFQLRPTARISKRFHGYFTTFQPQRVAKLTSSSIKLSNFIKPCCRTKTFHTWMFHRVRHIIACLYLKLKLQAHAHKMHTGVPVFHPPLQSSNFRTRKYQQAQTHKMHTRKVHTSFPVYSPPQSRNFRNSEALEERLEPNIWWLLGIRLRESLNMQILGGDSRISEPSAICVWHFQ